MRRHRKPKLIRKRGSPFWNYDFRLAGHRFAESTGESDKSEAEKILDQDWRAAVALIERKKKTAREPMTFEAAAIRWWDEVGQHGKETDLVPHLDWLAKNLGPSKPLHKIIGSDVARLVALRRQDRVRVSSNTAGAPMTKPVSARTINRTVTMLLRRIVRRAIEQWNAYAGDPDDVPKWSKYLIEEKRKPPRLLRFDEEDQMQMKERPELTVAREFALMSGLRLAEVVSLTKFNVDFLNRRISIVQKGEQPRELAITPKIEALLRSQWHYHDTAIFTFAAKRTRRCPKTGTMFIKGQRYPLTYWGLTTARRRDWKKAGVAATFHDLRRTAGRRMRDLGGDGMEGAQELLGHADKNTTKLYVGETIDLDRQRAAMVRRDQAEAKLREKSHKKSRNAPPASANTLKGKR